MRKESRLYNRKRVVSSINGVDKIRKPHAKECNFIVNYRRINSKWVKGFKVRPQTIKFQMKTLVAKFYMLILAIFVFQSVSSGKGWKVKMNKWGYIKLKTFFPIKETINKMKWPPIEWKKICVNDISNKGFIFKIYKEFIKFKIRKTT